MASSSAIRVEDLKKYYGKVKAVDGISFEIAKGEKFGFLGPNGAGKTTTMRTILGLLQPTAGSVSILGQEIDPVKSVEFRNHIGYLPGELGMYENMTANQFLKYLANLYDLEISWERAKTIAKRMKLDMDRRIGELSKGNKQKVGIVATLMHNFDILVLDEPTSGLDPILQTEFYEILNEIHKETNCTIFLSSHFLPEVEKFCDQVAIIRLGKIIEISKIHELQQKNLKDFTILFEDEASLDHFTGEMQAQFGEMVLKSSKNKRLNFLINPKFSRQVIAIIMQEWEKAHIVDLEVENSTLEMIFMKYYEADNQKEGEA